MQQRLIGFTHRQIRAIEHDRKVLADIINEGRCIKFMDDTGLSAIDLHALMVQISKATPTQSKE